MRNSEGRELEIGCEGMRSWQHANCSGTTKFWSQVRDRVTVGALNRRFFFGEPGWRLQKPPKKAPFFGGEVVARWQKVDIIYFENL